MNFVFIVGIQFSGCFLGSGQGLGLRVPPPRLVPEDGGGEDGGGLDLGAGVAAGGGEERPDDPLPRVEGEFTEDRPPPLRDDPPDEPDLGG